MELFLNFLWLLLFIPAWWVWQRKGRSYSPVRGFLVLGCVLVLLFPVISADDDLHAAPQVTEESSSTKRTLKHGDCARVQNHLSSPSACLTLGMNVFQGGEACVEPSNFFRFPPTHARGILGERAPPSISSM